MKKFKGKKVLILGSGGIKIGQAGEFDYSGSQAIKALKEEGIKTILVNPNIATIQTDSNMADTVYLEPLNVASLKKILQKEKPAGILLSFGGQTALNLGLKLHDEGILEKEGVEVLGTHIETIRLSEDRELFKKRLSEIGIKSPQSYTAFSVQEAKEFAQKIGYPIMIRSGFSLGGLGSGKINSEEELYTRAGEALSKAPHILIEEYLFGFKEIEYEVIRDSNDQALTICNMENFDPMGIHTGESIVIAPSQTLNNYEYHMLRDISIKIAKSFGIQGECNVQFALDPKTSDYRVIEMNARLSRSSALASKATGYPLAFVAAKLALGYHLHEIPNMITKKTTCFFEPALDYVALKIPRWDIQKLKSAERKIGTEMKSVGEVMAIGKSFPEALQKAIRMLNIGSSGIDDTPSSFEDAQKDIANPTDLRLFALYSFFQKGGSVEQASSLTQIDPWFLEHIHLLASFEKELKTKPLSKERLKTAKELGFSDTSIAKFTHCTENNIRQKRKEQNILPYIKQIDTLAGEYDAQTNYLYCTYHADSHDISPDLNCHIILGSGPYCIGSSVEFDWCAVNMARTLRFAKIKTVLINSNPETVSTDFDESDKLYFEELTLERIQDICDFESPKGIVVSVGGQIANNLALALHKNNYPLIGTKAEDIDRAENREKFSSLLKTLGIDQPEWQRVSSLKNGTEFAQKIGYPVLIRPSYVLSGAAMNIVKDEKTLIKYLKEATSLSPDHPVVISKFISDAKELEVDGIAQNGKIVISAIAEHIENAGVHSGDATIVLPPQNLYLKTIRQTKKITKDVVKALNITGPFNMQFIAKGQKIKVIECNVRSSRSLPFVSKVTGHNFIQIAGEVLLNNYTPQNYETLELDHVGVKSPQFSYQRLKGANPVARVEMASTGEVACLKNKYLDAFFSSWLATDQEIKGKKIVVSIGGQHKVKLLESLKALEEKGWEFIATEGTHDYLSKKGIASLFIHKASEKCEPNIATLIEKREIDLILNIPRSGTDTKTDGFRIRRLAIDHNIPLITNLKVAEMFLKCLIEIQPENLPIKSWEEYISLKDL